MTLQEFIDYRLSQQNIIHDFSLGALLTYHKLTYLYEHDNRVFLDKDFVWFKPTQKKTNLFLYRAGKIGFYIDSNTSISSAKFLPDLKVKSKQEEVFYQVEKLEKNYHSYNKPINIFEKRPDLGLELRDFAENKAELKDLHQEWVQYKLSLPKTHRISFPTARYRNTLEDLPIPTYRKAIYIKDQLYGYIVFSLENGVAFELAFVTLYWKPEFQILNGLNQYIFAYCVIQLQKQGIRFVNSGYALNKNLKTFKQCALKANKVYRYNYSVNNLG